MIDIHLENKQFMQQRENAAKAYVYGNPSPVIEITTEKKEVA